MNYEAARLVKVGDTVEVVGGYYGDDIDEEDPPLASRYTVERVNLLDERVVFSLVDAKYGGAGWDATRFRKVIE